MTSGSPSVPRVGDLGADRFATRLSGPGIGVRIGPFKARLVARVPALDTPLFHLYRDYPLVDDDAVYSFHVRLTELRAFPSMTRRVVRFEVDGRAPHEDMPAYQALAVLEWGLNLVIALRSHAFLMIHAAVVERDGRALVLPAAPGMGKTTLCAALAHRGWRLLSDEFGLIRPGRNEMIPVPRPMALKNDSIEIIGAFAPEAEMGPMIPDTRKGNVAHVRPPADAIHADRIAAPPRWIVFPQWVAGARTELVEMPQADGFMMIASNAFNYEMLGEAAFRAVEQMVGQARCYRLRYSGLDNALDCLHELAA